jgi:hypothetical protein
MLYRGLSRRYPAIELGCWFYDLKFHIQVPGIRLQFVARHLVTGSAPCQPVAPSHKSGYLSVTILLQWLSLIFGAAGGYASNLVAIAEYLCPGSKT